MADDTHVTLKQHLEKAIAESERRSDLRVDHIKEAIETSYAQLEIRLGAMNHIREQLTAQAQTLATKDVVAAIKAQVDELRADLQENKGRHAVEIPLVDTALKMALGVIVAWVVFKLTGR